MIPLSSLLLVVLAAVAPAWAEVLAPLNMPNDHKLVIPNKYIVVFKDPSGSANRRAQGAGKSSDPADFTAQAIRQLEHVNWIQAKVSEPEELESSKVEHAFKIDGFSGYTGYFSPALLDEIRKRQEVDYVEADQLMYALRLDGSKPSWSETLAAINELHDALFRRQVMSSKRYKQKQALRARETREAMKELFRAAATTALTQDDATWGLYRLSHSDIDDLGREDGPSEYLYPSTAGSSVDVYVIDTGINVEHEEFEGRARWGATMPQFDLDIDGNGHGTHCAGTIGSRRYGVAKRANLVAVKVLRTNGFGTTSDVIKGVEWVTRDHRRKFRANKSKGKGPTASAANMSLGGGRSLTLEKMVDRAVAAGVHFAVAAGNDAEDACGYSPAASDGAVTVGASTSRDTVAFFSNHGKCVDVFAPGLNIKSTWIGGTDAVNTISGTSMASPHVAGVMALYLGEDSNWKPHELKAELKEHALKDLLTSIPSPTTPNMLVNIGHLLDKFAKKPGKSRKSKSKPLLRKKLLA